MKKYDTIWSSGLFYKRANGMYQSRMQIVTKKDSAEIYTKAGFTQNGRTTKGYYIILPMLNLTKNDVNRIWNDLKELAGGLK